MIDKVKDAFFEGYRACLSEVDRDWTDYVEDCKTYWACSYAKKVSEEEEKS